MSSSHPLTAVYIVVATGFAMFSMFFGSGNLVFPITLVGVAGGEYTYAVFGFLFTAVVLPFLGLLAIMLFNGSYEDFFGRLDKYTAFILPLLILALIGPFGVIPRCITVAHGSFEQLMPGMSLILFSAVFCIVTFLLMVDTRRIVPILGAVLTPLLLLAILVITFFGIRDSQMPVDGGAISGLTAFTTGLAHGYNTMDLMAAFFFASLIVKYIEARLEGHPTRRLTHASMILGAMLLGALLLAAIYVSFAYLGAAYQAQLAAVPPEQSIGEIAHLTLGPYAGPVVATAVVLACLTTAVALTSVSADFAQRHLFVDKVPIYLAIVLVLVISFFVSTLEFSGIAAFLGPILVALYPGLIVLTVLNIISKKYGNVPVRLPVYMTFLVAGSYLLMQQF